MEAPSIELIDNELTDIDRIEPEEGFAPASLDEWKKASPTVNRILSHKDEHYKEELAKLDNLLDKIETQRDEELEQALPVAEPVEEIPEVSEWIDGEVKATPKPRFTQDGLLHLLLEEEKPAAELPALDEVFDGEVDE